MFRQAVEKYSREFSGNISPFLEIYANFEIIKSDGTDHFHVQVFDGKVEVKDGSASQPILIFSSGERTVMEILEMGVDLLDILFTKPFYVKVDEIRIPDLEQTFYFKSETDSGWPVGYKILVQNAALVVREDVEGDKDIGVFVRSGVLKDLLRGKVNIPFALIRGQIKIRNKKEFFKVFRNFGLNI